MPMPDTRPFVTTQHPLADGMIRSKEIKIADLKIGGKNRKEPQKAIMRDISIPKSYLQDKARHIKKESGIFPIFQTPQLMFVI